jgi:hypothetical protein
VQALYLTFGLQGQLALVLRAAAWMGIWFGIAETPRSWAADAHEWNALAGQTVWHPIFLRVHSTMWRLLLVFTIFKGTALLSAAAGKALSLQFHHANHFEQMQVGPFLPCC